MQVGKYQLVNKLATGGMAEVFLAKAAGPMGFEKTLVLKRILPHMAEDPAFVEMFLGEAKLAAQLNHPNIVQIFDFGEAEGSYYLAMEYIDGPNLRALAKRARQAGEELPPALCAKIIAYACEGLAFAHAFMDPQTGEPLGLIHRDISPDNIMVSRQGAVKVVDFGIAKAAGQGNRTQTGVVKGKLAYMPPEQLQAKNLDLRVDVYALGVVLYEMLTGQKPFDAATDVSIMQAILFEPLIPVGERRPELPQELQRIVERALAKNRDERYPDCHAFREDLERFVMSTGEPVGAYQISQLIKRTTGEAGGSMPTPPPGSGSSKSNPRAVSNPQLRTGEKVPTGSRAAAPQESRPGLRPAATAEPASPEEATRPVSRERKAVTGSTPAPVREETSSPNRVKSRPRITAADIQEPVDDVDQRPTEMDQDALTHMSSGPAPGSGRPKWLIPAVAGAVLLVGGGALVALRSPPQPVAPAPGAAVPIGVVKGEPLPNIKVAPPPEAAKPPPAEPKPAEPVAVGDKAPPATPPEGAAPTPGEPATEKPAVGGTVAEAKPEEPKTVASRTETAPTGGRPSSKTRTTRTTGGTTVKRTSEGGTGTVEFRVRPYATVFIDGKNMGQTPFAPLQLPGGKHSVKLVNNDLGKEITKVLSVEAGKSNIFKYNLLEE